MSIREAEPSDVQVITHLEYEYADMNPALPGTVLSAINRPEIDVLVYEVEETGIVGHIFVNEDREVSSYVIHPRFRGEGRGTELLEECSASKARAQIDNKASNKALKKAGFERTDEDNKFYEYAR